MAAMAAILDFRHGGYYQFPIRKMLAIFLSTNHPDASYKVSRQLVFWFRRRSKK